MSFNKKIFVCFISLLLFAFNTISVFASDIVEGSLSLSEKVSVAPYILSEYVGHVSTKLGYSMKSDVDGSIIQHAIGEKLASEGAFFVDSSIDAQNNIRNTIRLTRDGYNTLKSEILDKYYNVPNNEHIITGTNLTSDKNYSFDSVVSELKILGSYHVRSFASSETSDFINETVRPYCKVKSVSINASYQAIEGDFKYTYLPYTVYFEDGTSFSSYIVSTYRFAVIYPPVPLIWLDYDSYTDYEYPSYNSISNFGYPVSVNSNKDGSYYLTNDKTVNDDYVVPDASGNVFNNIDESVTYIVNNYPSSIIPSNTGDNGNTGGNTDSGDGTLGDNANKDDSYIDDLEFPTENKPGEGSSILDWLMYWVQSVINFVLSLLKMLLKVFTSLFDFLKSLIDITSELASIWNLLFGFLPSPIPELVVLTFSCVIVISFIHFLK
ncbi:hypothetical protein [Clostridium butyricum]|uniref:hypothetical protein n=1 Tax=Clostridium butyricum TaxID=1492 RepID=UPI0024BB02ED|nr:hypothetical protein [Clostridium butyricum]